MSISSADSPPKSIWEDTDPRSKPSRKNKYHVLRILVIKNHVATPITRGIKQQQYVSIFKFSNAIFERGLKCMKQIRTWRANSESRGSNFCQLIDWQIWIFKLIIIFVLVNLFDCPRFFRLKSHKDPRITEKSADALIRMLRPSARWPFPYPLTVFSNPWKQKGNPSLSGKRAA